MSRRGYPLSEGFVEEREREYFRDGSIDEVDTIYRARGGPEFLRDDYGRSSAGPLILPTRDREPIIEEPAVHREIVTHHRHIDHGKQTYLLRLLALFMASGLYFELYLYTHVRTYMQWMGSATGLVHYSHPNVGSAGFSCR